MVNFLFIMHQNIHDAVWRVGVVEGYNATGYDEDSRRLQEAYGLAGWGFDNSQPDNHFAHFAYGHGRGLRGSGGGGGTTGAAAEYPYGVPTGNRAGAYVILQALVALSSWVRLLYYFKGILRLGTLVHTL